METADEYMKQIDCAIKAYRDASKFFKQLGNRAAELECEAEVSFTSGVLATSDGEGQKTYLRAIKLFGESAEIYSKVDDKEGFARAQCRIASSSYLLMSYNISSEEYDRIALEGMEFARKACEISKEIKNIQILSESLFDEFIIAFSQMSVKNF